MIYYNPYNQIVPQYVPQPMMQQQQPEGIVRVNGRDSALQYQLPPNSMSPALFDNNGKMFYIVSTDGTGAKTVETFDFAPHVEQQTDLLSEADFVSRSEFQGLVSKVNQLIGDINGIHGSVPAAATAVGSTAAESCE